MYSELEEYLEKIDHFLVVEGDRAEILAEIKSHILDKVDKEYGELNGKTLRATIESYGDPRSIAEKYSDGYQLISPTYKQHLVVYTIIVFLVHGSLSVLSYLYGLTFSLKILFVLPLFFVPHIHSFPDLVGHLVMNLVFDIGLVGLFFYFLTQQKKRINLPWPVMNIPPAPKKKVFYIQTVLSILLLVVYLKLGTLFFSSFNLTEPVSIFGPRASLWYSLTLLSIVAISAISSGLRLVWNRHELVAIQYGLYTVMMFVLWSNPLEDECIRISFFNTKGIYYLLCLVFTVYSIFKLAKSLLAIWRKGRTVKRLRKASEPSVVATSTS